MWIIKHENVLNFWNRMKIETYFDVILKGESCFWIFTRSLDELNKFSAIIKISKEDRSQKVFASFGTFIFDAKETMYFKIFLKQQLIDFSSKCHS